MITVFCIHFIMLFHITVFHLFANTSDYTTLHFQCISSRMEHKRNLKSTQVVEVAKSFIARNEIYNWKKVTNKIEPIRHFLYLIFSWWLVACSILLSFLREKGQLRAQDMNYTTCPTNKDIIHSLERMNSAKNEECKNKSWKWSVTSYIFYAYIVCFLMQV